MLSLQLLLRDWRAGELRLLALAVVVSVAAVTSVAWLAQRIGVVATRAPAAELLGADLAVRSSQPIPEPWRQQARAWGLRTARTAEFPSVVLTGERTELVSVKAVDPAYPLRGKLRVRAGHSAPEHASRGNPGRGRVWVDPRLLTRLDLAIGDRIRLGRSTFRITRLITLEPDREGFLYSLAPRVLLRWDDLADTGLVQPASRVRYQLLLAGSAAPLQRYAHWLAPRVPSGVELVHPSEMRFGIREVAEKAQRFLSLAALLTVVVAGVAMLLTTRHYAERQVLGVALMRCFGATRGRVIRLLAGKLFWLGVIAGALGALVGYLVHLAMLAVLGGFVVMALPAPGLGPLLLGWLTALAALLGFSSPTLLRLQGITPLRVLRREAGGELTGGSAPYGLAVAIVFALMWWQAADFELASYVFAAVFGSFMLLVVGAGILVLGVRHWHRRGGPGRMLWLSGLSRRPGAAVVQIAAVGLGLMALYLLLVVRTDLLDAWRDRIPVDAPNQFLINIQPAEVAAVRRLLASRASVEPRFYPMIRGRLVARNGQPLTAEDYTEDRAKRLVQREFNLSWAQRLAADNRVIAGRWWSAERMDPQQLSVEQGLAESLGIRLGDRLTFRVGGETVSATVTSLRAVDWDSFHVNFFVLAPPGLLQGFPATWITSFYLPPDSADLMAQLVRKHPSITVIDVDTLLRTARQMINQGSRVVEIMALMTLTAGLLVLFSALQITGEERRLENALLRALGATRGHLRRMARLEFLLVGGAAGTLAGFAATAAGYIAAERLFELPYQADWAAIPIGAALGVAVVWLAAVGAGYRYHNVSPMRLLRAAQ
ncbi:MAG: FtsX-like permease family protein [Nitrococcus mobilis]|nr:FtsX-like permease family protein [Nitrococcus mobilis]